METCDPCGVGCVLSLYRGLSPTAIRVLSLRDNQGRCQKAPSTEFRLRNRVVLTKLNRLQRLRPAWMLGHYARHMYSVDSKDTVVKISDVPQSSVGAPCPMILAGEGYLYLAFFLQDTPAGWDGSTVRVVGEDTSGEPVAIVIFNHIYAHFFGPPNDEAFSGHPLASKGLRPYSVFEVRDSSWIRKLERMNSVHPYHRPERFAELRHFIFAFHDTTFECIAQGFSSSVREGSVARVLADAFQELHDTSA